MNSPLSHSEFLNHLFMSKTIVKHEMYLNVDSMVDRVYDKALTDLQHFFTFDPPSTGQSFPSSPVPSPPMSIEHEHGTDEPVIEDGYDEAFVVNTQTSHHSTSLENVYSVDASCQTNSTRLLETLHLDEIDDFVNVPLEPQQKDASINSSLFSRSLVPSTSTDQSIQNTEMDQQEQPHQLSHNFHYTSDDDATEEDSAYGDQIEEQESSPPVKKSRLEDKKPTTEPKKKQSRVTKQSAKNAKQNQTHQTKPIKVNNPNTEEGSSQPTPPPNSSTHYKQIITLSRQCPNCPKTFPKDKLNDHMKRAHSIDQYRCLVKDCRQSFDYKFILSEHISFIHHHTAQWHCDKCPKHFPTYNLLSNHNLLYHQLGHFQCAFPRCSFTADCHIKVRIHYTQKHRKKSQFFTFNECTLHEIQV